VAGVPKNILIFSDGTGQAGGIPGVVPSNVYKLYRACPVIPGVQETFYDPGLGSPPDGVHWRRWRLIYNMISQATGLGISWNIVDCYDALIKMYEPGDRIYLFGFSRGAYTVRSLGGMLALCGIPTRSGRGHDPRTDHRARRRLAWRALRWVYQTYGSSDAKRRKRTDRAAKYRARYASHVVAPYFIGVWDTVRSLGLPGISRFIPWRHAFHDATLHPDVQHARHALALDENRAMFLPELWEELEADHATGRIKQVWFPGVHSDVGGGYPERELSDLTLAWMITQATKIPNPVIVDATLLSLSPSHRGMQHDGRFGLGVLWVKGTRVHLRPEPVECEDHVERRFLEPSVPSVRGQGLYRPIPLAQHPAFVKYYDAIAAEHRGRWQRLSSLVTIRSRIEPPVARR
jgi:uncharacterized protein (DUF2235 family)